MTLMNTPWSLFRAVLDTAEASLCVVDRTGRLVFINPSARRLLDANGALPSWALERLEPLLDRIDSSGAPTVDKWVVGNLVLRARVRPLNAARSLMLVELDVAHSGGAHHVEQTLARTLALSPTDARLLARVWRGMSNEDICDELDLKLGTVKSRLSRMYRRIGVRRRSAAVLRAADALG